MKYLCFPEWISPDKIIYPLSEKTDFVYFSHVMYKVASSVHQFTLKYLTPQQTREIRGTFICSQPMELAKGGYTVFVPCIGRTYTCITGSHPGSFSIRSAYISEDDLPCIHFLCYEIDRFFECWFADMFLDPKEPYGT